MKSEKTSSVVFEAFEAGSHLSGVVGILGSLEWDNFGYDSDLTRKSLTAPGVTTIIAVARDTGEVVGFAQVFGDGVFQARTSACSRWTRSGAAGGSWKKPFARVGAGRMDLTSSDEGLEFYRTLKHREQVGFRIYPDPDKD